MRACQLGLLAFTLAFVTVPVAGQTRFTWPDTTVDVAAYTTLEQCHAVVARTRRGLASREELVSGIWRDTLLLDPAEAWASLPAPVGETARQCLARFATVDAVPLAYFRTLLPLYLLAGWDAKAKELVERRLLTALAPAAERELAAVLDTVTSIYQGFAMAHHDFALRVQPARAELAQQFVLKYAPRVADRVRRLRVYMRLLIATDSLGERVLKPLIAARALALVDSLTPDERAAIARASGVPTGEEDGMNLEQRLYALLTMSLGQRTFLDSLRQSTAAYVQLKRQTWARATGRPPEAYGSEMPLGEHAPALEGDFWLGPPDSSRLRPRPGRVSLVVFLTNPECMGRAVDSDREMYRNCAQRLIPLRRLAERFPALELTVVAQTHGYFIYLKEGLTPALEAELTRRWLDSFGLVRAALTMTTTEAWRLPGPDGRRIARTIANRTNYTFGQSWGVENASAFLIDHDGIIVHTALMGRHTEPQFAELIEILLERRIARP